MNIVLQSITNDLSNIILSYCDINIYSILYKLDPLVYNFDRYETLMLKKFKMENHILIERMEKYKLLYDQLFPEFIKNNYKKWNLIKLIVITLILNRIYNNLLRNLCQIIRKFNNSKNYDEISLIYYDNILSIDNINIIDAKTTGTIYDTLSIKNDKIQYLYKVYNINRSITNCNRNMCTLKSTPIWLYMKYLMRDYELFLNNTSYKMECILIDTECTMEICYVDNSDNDSDEEIYQTGFIEIIN
jgi:hypothetical protein